MSNNAAPTINKTTNGIINSPIKRLPSSQAQSNQLTAPSKIEPIANTEEG